MRLEALRARDGLSREAVARRMSISAMTIRNWERDDTEPTASQVKQLADIREDTEVSLLKAISYAAHLCYKFAEQKELEG